MGIKGSRDRTADHKRFRDGHDNIDWHKMPKDEAQVSDMLFDTVKLGKSTFAEIARHDTGIISGEPEELIKTKEK